MSDAFSENTDPAETDPVAELVGEGKKYKTVADLAKAKLEADRFIEQLKSENKGIREEFSNAEAAQAQLDELRQEIANLKKQSNAVQPRDNTNPQLDESAVEALVSRVITQREATNTAAENIKEANKQLIASAGSVEQAQSLVKAKASELGLSIDELKAVAAKSPTAFLKMVSDGKTVPPAGVSAKGSHNTESGPVISDTKPGTKAYYENIRKTNKKLYWSPTIQNQIAEAVKNGTYELT